MDDRKNTIRKKRIAAVCMLLSCALLFTACGTVAPAPQAGTVPAGETESVPEPAPEPGGGDSSAESGTKEPEPEPAAAPAGDRRAPGENAIDKEETVYIKAAADGTLKKATVETVLNYPGENGYVIDWTNLDSIRNTEGDEEFRQNRDGTLIWEDHGEKIRYEGKSREAVPVSVRISCTLDGVPVRPEELAGKSGHLRMRFDYINRKGETRRISLRGSEPRDVQTRVPFLALSMAVLPDDVFTNLGATNGRILSLGEENIFLGWALPGLSEALSLSDSKLTEELELPSYAELEADVRNFKLDFTATVFSNGLLEDMDREDLEKLYDLTADVDALYDAAAQLAAGSEAFAEGMSAYAGSVNGVLATARTLAEDLPALENELMRIAGDIPTLQALLDGTPAEMESAAANLTAMADTLDGLKDWLVGLADAGAAASGLIDSARLKNSAAAEWLNDAAWQLEVMTAGMSLNLDAEGLNLTEEQKALIAAQFGDAAGAAAGLRGDLEAAAEQIAGANGDLGTAKAYTDAIAGTNADALGESAATLRGAAVYLGDAASAIRQTAESAVIRDFIAKVNLLSAGMASTLPANVDYAAQIREFMNAGDLLSSSARQLSEGNAAFRDGIAELADEGGWKLRRLARELEALREADRDYTSFGGIAAGRSGSVRFIVETDPIE